MLKRIFLDRLQWEVYQVYSIRYVSFQNGEQGEDIEWELVI